MLLQPAFITFPELAIRNAQDLWLVTSHASPNPESVKHPQIQINRSRYTDTDRTKQFQVYFDCPILLDKVNLRLPSDRR